MVFSGIDGAEPVNNRGGKSSEALQGTPRLRHRGGEDGVDSGSGRGQVVRLKTAFGQGRR